MNAARFDTFEEMLASVFSSGRGIICGRNQGENEEIMASCVEEMRRRFRTGNGTAYIGFTHKGEPFCADNAMWGSRADITECVFQMHIDHGRDIYRAILMR